VGFDVVAFRSKHSTGSLRLQAVRHSTTRTLRWLTMACSPSRWPRLAFGTMPDRHRAPVGRQLLQIVPAGPMACRKMALRHCMGT